MFIQTEITPNPNSLKFLPGKIVSNHGSFEVSKKDETNNDLIDNYFITTSPDVIKTKINRDKINFLPIPVDPNVENGKFYELKNMVLPTPGPMCKGVNPVINEKDQNK